MRAGGGRGAAHRPYQIPEPRHRSRWRASDRPAGRGARPAERAAAAEGPVVPGRRLDQRAGHARRHGGQQFLRLALDRLRQHGAQRARYRGLHRLRRALDVWSDERSGRPADLPGVCRQAKEPVPARAGRDRGALPEALAQGGGLQPGPPRTAACQCRASAGRFRRHARVLRAPAPQAFTHSAAARARRLPLSEVLHGDGLHPAHRRARSERGGAGR